MNMFKRLLLSFFLLFYGVFVFAQGPPIYTDTPILTGLEGRGIRFYGEYSRRVNDNSFTLPITVPLTLFSRIQVGATLPLVVKSVKNGPENEGLGDLEAFGKVRLMSREFSRKTFVLNVKARHILPTGKSDGAPRLTKGVSQTAGGFVAGLVSHGFGVYGETMYNVVAGNHPNNLIYNLAFVLPIHFGDKTDKMVNISLEFNGDYVFNNGTNLVLISPGLQYVVSKRFMVEGGVQIPSVDDAVLNQQTDFRTRLGTRFLLF